MRLSTLVFTLLSLTLSTPNFVHAQESDSLTTAQSNRSLGWFRADIYRVSLGFGSVKLHNPEGFDVPIKTYDDGSPDYSTTNTMFNIVGERAIGWQRRQKRLWNLHYDAEDYDGLTLSSLTVGAGVAIDPARANALGGRLAIGANIGITQSETFFDNAVHPAAELWVSAGVQLSRLVLDLSIRERLTMSASLDERRASPRTQISMLSVGWLF